MPTYEHFPKGGFVDTLYGRRLCSFFSFSFLFFFRDMVASSKAHVHKVNFHLMFECLFNVFYLEFDCLRN